MNTSPNTDVEPISKKQTVFALSLNTRFLTSAILTYPQIHKHIVDFSPSHWATSTW